MAVGISEGTIGMGCACGGSRTRDLEYVATDRVTKDSKVFEDKPSARAWAASRQGGATVVARKKTS